MQPLIKRFLHKIGQPRHRVRWLRSAVIALIVLFYVLVAHADNYAKAIKQKPTPLPTIATLVDLKGKISGILQRNTIPRPLKPGNTLQRRQIIVIPGDRLSWAHLQFPGKVKKLNPLVQLGISYKSSSKYTFACGVSGNAVVGWGLIDAARGGCMSLRLNSAGRLVVGSGNKKPVQSANNLLKADTPHGPTDYCNAVADSGRGWGFSSSWDFFSSDDPCQKALQKCRESSSGSECSVVSFGEWKANDDNLTASVQCDEKPPLTLTGSSNEIGAQLLALEEKAQATKADICVLDIYYPNEALVSPASSPNGEGEYLFQTEQLNDTTLAIDALVGNFTIQLGENPQSEIILQKGERYLLIDNQQNRRETINPKEIAARSDSVQVFLNPNNWPEDAYLKEKIEKVRAELGLDDDIEPPTTPEPPAPPTTPEPPPTPEPPAPNQPPVANADTATTQSSRPVTIDVLTNDSDPDGDEEQLRVTQVTPAQNGTVRINRGRTVIYSPNPDFVGSTDQFTYTISDEDGRTATATVTVKLEQAPNRPPQPEDDVERRTLDDELYQGVEIDVLANDSDPDRDPLRVIEVTQGKSGQVKLKSDRTVTYTLTRVRESELPTPSSPVIDTFTYTVSDDKGGTAKATVTILQIFRVE